MMVNKTVKAERKQTSRGQRKHVRRMKQEARKGSMPDSQTKKKMRAAESLKA